MKTNIVLLPLTIIPLSGGMGGENLDYGDQDFYEITDLK